MGNSITKCRFWIPRFLIKGLKQFTCLSVKGIYSNQTIIHNSKCKDKGSPGSYAKDHLLTGNRKRKPYTRIWQGTHREQQIHMPSFYICLWLPRVSPIISILQLELPAYVTVPRTKPEQAGSGEKLTLLTLTSVFMQLLVGVQVVPKGVFVDWVLNKCPIIAKARFTKQLFSLRSCLRHHKPTEPVFGGDCKFP